MEGLAETNIIVDREKSEEEDNNSKHTVDSTDTNDNLPCENDIPCAGRGMYHIRNKILQKYKYCTHTHTHTHTHTNNSKII